MEKIFNRYGMSTSEVAHAGYEALKKGKPIVIPGKRFSMTTMATRFLPRKWVQKLMTSVIK